MSRASNIPLSVIMPVYNDKDRIARALDAVLNQSYADFELMLVDDGCTDGSSEILNDYAAKDSRIRLLTNKENKGSFYSATWARQAARGDYFYGAASDDFVAPGFFDKAMTMADKNPDKGIVCGKIRCVTPSGRPFSEIGVSSWHSPQAVDPCQFLNEYLKKESPMHSLGSATIYKKDAYNAVGGLRQELGHWRDTFVLRSVGLRYGACYIPDVVVNWTVRPNSFSQTALADKDEMLRILDNAVQLMRSNEFKENFPANYVSNWERNYRRCVGVFASPPAKLYLRYAPGLFSVPVVGSWISHLSDLMRRGILKLVTV